MYRGVSLVGNSFYRFGGSMFAFFGAMLFLFPIFVFIFWIVPPFGVFILQISDIPVLLGYLLLGFIMLYAGVKIHTRFKRVQPFVTKGGGPIHIAEVWKKGNELGLYLTMCGKVVSINQSSGRTAHVEYRLVTTADIICSDCSIKQGTAILDSVAKRGDG
jgi:hypothetical protein